MNPVDFKMNIRAQRAKTFDLRRKVLLKNFFRNQNIFIHNATSAALESFDFSKHEQSHEDILTNYNMLNESSAPGSVTTSKSDDEPFKNEGKIHCDNNSEINEPFSFTTMMVALPDSPSKSRNCHKSDAGTDPFELDNTMVNTVSSTTEIADSFHSKIKRKLSLRGHSFSRRTKQKTEVGKRTSRSKLDYLVKVKSPKRKRTSFRKKIHKMFKSSVNVKNSAESKPDENDSDNSSHIKFDSKSDQLATTLKYNNTIGMKSVATQTDMGFIYDSCNKDSENQRLRLENKHLKNKVQLLLKLNENKTTHRPNKLNGQTNFSNKSCCDVFRSNQENKTSFVPSMRVTRSHSVHEDSWNKDYLRIPRHSRRTRSVCIPKNNEFENNYYNRFSHNATTQPFKPMQSFVVDGIHLRRKRRFSPPKERSHDYRHFSKRPRKLSLS